MAEVFGQSTNTWGKPNEGSFPNPVYEGDGTSKFNWAESVDPELPTNRLEISSLPFDVSFNTPFEVGMLSYFNGSVYTNTVVESVPLQIQLDLDSPTDQTKTFSFDLKLETTFDNWEDDPENWKDFVYFPDVLPNETFKYGGKEYTLEILGFSKDGGNTLENRFRVQEQEADSAGLYAKITEVKTKLPPGDKNAETEGATVITGDFKKKAWVETDGIGFTEGGVRDVSDIYKFSIQEQCEITVILDQLAQNADLEILDADGTSVLFQSTETGARTKESITEILEAGDYYVRVYTPGSEKTDYRLSVQGQTYLEEKDSFKTAKDLGVLNAEQVTELDQIGLGKGKSRDTEDYYKFQVTEEKNDVQIILDQLKADANIELYESDGSLVKTSDKTSRTEDKIDAELLKGEYYIKVIPQGNAKTDYLLTVNSLAIKGEVNDQAPGVNLGSLIPESPITQSGKIGEKTGGQRDQNDYYTFDLPVDTNIYLTLGKLKADANVQLLDEFGDEIAISNNSGKAGEEIEQELEAGTYTVQVYPGGQSSTDYQLKISAEAPFIDDYPTPEEAFNLGTFSGKKVFNNEIGKGQGRAERDQKDWIKFEVTKDSWVDINLDKLRQNADLELYDSDGKSLLNYSRESGQRTSETIQDVLEAGTYYLQVLPKVSGRTGYQLSVDISDVSNKVDEFEVGNLNSLGSYTKTGSIGLAADRRNELDQYRFSLSEDSDVVFNLDDLNGDANIRLKNSQGVLLRDSTNSGDSSEEISDNLDAGDYILEVLPFGSAKTNYTLTMQTAGGGVDNDSPASLATNMTNILNTDQLYSATDDIGFSLGSSSRDQKDYYTFTLSEEQAVSIKLNGLSANANVELLDSSETLIRSSTNSGTAAESISDTLEVGQYYVVVSPLGSDRTDYNLSVSLGSSGGSDADGTFPTATDIGSLGDYEASDSIGLQGDGYRDINDYRKFTISEKSNFSLNLTNLKQNADVELYDADQVLLKSSRQSGQADESIKTVLTSGDYFVRVLPKGSVGTSYDLNLSASPVGQNTTVDLGTLGADPLTNKGLSGESGDTVDEFTFIVGSSNFVDINLTGLSANANLELYSKTTNQLLGSSVNGGTSNENINSFLSPDTYLVKVLAVGGLSPYNLEVAAG